MTNSKTLWVSDMDGTLLGSDSRVSATTASILNRLIDEQGLLFTVATARTHATVVPLMSEVRSTLPYIVFAGAAMWDPLKNEFIDVMAIDNDVAAGVVRAFEQHGMRPLIYRQHGNTIHVLHTGTLSAQEQAFVNERKALPLKTFILNAPNYHTCDDPALLIFAMNHYATLERIYNQLLGNERCVPTLYHDIFDPTVGLLEIHARGCSKAASIKRLAKRIGAHRIVAFGDNRNDIAMLQAADVAIAVENAVPEVKALAHHIIPPNTTHSVARHIATHL